MRRRAQHSGNVGPFPGFGPLAAARAAQANRRAAVTDGDVHIGRPAGAQGRLEAELPGRGLGRRDQMGFAGAGDLAARRELERFHLELDAGVVGDLGEHGSDVGLDVVDDIHVERSDVQREPAGGRLVVKDGAALEHRHVDDRPRIPMSFGMRELQDAVDGAPDCLVHIRQAATQGMPGRASGNDPPPVDADGAVADAPAVTEDVHEADGAVLVGLVDDLHADQTGLFMGDGGEDQVVLRLEPRRDECRGGSQDGRRRSSSVEMKTNARPDRPGMTPTAFGVSSIMTDVRPIWRMRAATALARSRSWPEGEIMAAISA